MTSKDMDSKLATALKAKANRKAKPVPISRRAQTKKKIIMSRSAPVRSTYKPPKAPRRKPLIATRDPPPIHLPKSPCVENNISDIPLSRSLEDGRFSPKKIPFSMPQIKSGKLISKDRDSSTSLESSSYGAKRISVGTPTVMSILREAPPVRQEGTKISSSTRSSYSTHQLGEEKTESYNKVKTDDDDDIFTLSLSEESPFDPRQSSYNSNNNNTNDTTSGPSLRDLKLFNNR